MTMFPKLALRILLAVSGALALTFPAVANDRCSDIDVDRGTAVRVIAEECQAAGGNLTACSAIAKNAAHRLAAM